MNRDNVLQLIKTELLFTDSKCPKFNSTHEGFSVLKEKVDGLWAEIKKSKSYNTANPLMIDEAVQVAAMSIKFVENLYRHNDEVF